MNARWDFRPTLAVFFNIAWTPDERVLSVDGSQNGMVVRTSSRTVIFKSQSTGWTEVR
jgi:hypothetical protein